MDDDTVISGNDIDIFDRFFTPSSMQALDRDITPGIDMYPVIAFINPQ